MFLSSLKLYKVIIRASDASQMYNDSSGAHISTSNSNFILTRNFQKLSWEPFFVPLMPRTVITEILTSETLA